jgi:hypothetical protein
MQERGASIKTADVVHCGRGASRCQGQEAADQYRPCGADKFPDSQGRDGFTSASGHRERDHVQHCRCLERGAQDLKDLLDPKWKGEVRHIPATAA